MSKPIIKTEDSEIKQVFDLKEKDRRLKNFKSNRFDLLIFMNNLKVIDAR